MIVVAKTYFIIIVDIVIIIISSSSDSRSPGHGTCSSKCNCTRQVLPQVYRTPLGDLTLQLNAKGQD